MGSPLLLSPVNILGDDQSLVVEVRETRSEILVNDYVCVDPDNITMPLFKTAEENCRLDVPTESGEVRVSHKLGIRQGRDPVAKGIRGVGTADDDG
jgi:hypothetical protein